MCNGKAKVRPATGQEGPELEYRCSSTPSLSSALMGGGGQGHTLVALPPGKTRYPLYRRLVGAQDRSGRVRKIWPLPGFDPRTVKPVASCCTDWAIADHTHTHTPQSLPVSPRAIFPILLHKTAHIPLITKQQKYDLFPMNCKANQLHPGSWMTLINIIDAPGHRLGQSALSPAITIT